MSGRGKGGKGLGKGSVKNYRYNPDCNIQGITKPMIQIKPGTRNHKQSLKKVEAKRILNIIRTLNNVVIKSSEDDIIAKLLKMKSGLNAIIDFDLTVTHGLEWHHALFETIMELGYTPLAIQEIFETLWLNSLSPLFPQNKKEELKAYLLSCPSFDKFGSWLNNMGKPENLNIQCTGPMWMYVANAAFMCVPYERILELEGNALSKITLKTGATECVGMFVSAGLKSGIEAIFPGRVLNANSFININGRCAFDNVVMSSLKKGLFDNYNPNYAEGDSTTDWYPNALNVALPKGNGLCLEGADINVTSMTDYTSVNLIKCLIKGFIEYCHTVDGF
jgi:hypothetical protein